MKKNIYKLVILVFMIFTLFSCGKINKTSENNETSKEKKVDNISPIANEAWFKNSLHEIRNSKTRTSMIVKGDGTVVLKVMEPNNEQIGMVKDISTNETNYLYKLYEGEKVITSTYTGGDKQEYSSTEGSCRCVFYDKNGNEVGLETNTRFAYFSTKDKIFYSDNENGGEMSDTTIKYFDVNTKEIHTIDYPEINKMSGKILVSTDRYSNDHKNGIEEIIVYDENFKEFKRIEGYSLDNVKSENGIEIAYISRSKNQNNDDSDNRKINFLDSSFNYVFDQDVDGVLYDRKFPIEGIKVGDKAYDYDFSIKKKISEDMPAEERKSEWQISEDEKKKYESDRQKINDAQYDYVITFLAKDKVYFIAYKKEQTGLYASSKCDIYNDKLEKVMELDDLSSYYEELGYIFVDHDTIYNKNLEVIYKFDKKCGIEKHEKFGKTFFTDNSDINYNSVEYYNLYDENFNILYSGLTSSEFYTYDDYLLFTDNEGTKILDKDMNLVKSLDRKLDIKAWYSENQYREFEDLKTGRLGIIDKDFNIVVDNIKDISELKEKYFTYLNGFNYGLMDYEGRPVLTYSIFDTMREDAVEKDFNGEFVERYDEEYD